MPFCRHCGHGYEEQANFCPSCGQPTQAVPPPVDPTGVSRGEPLLELQSHFLATGQPTWLAVYDAFVEVYKVYDPRDRRTQRMRYEQVAQVSIRRGLLFSALVIESRGGDVMIGEGMSREDAEEARDLIEQRL